MTDKAWYDWIGGKLVKAEPEKIPSSTPSEKYQPYEGYFSGRVAFGEPEHHPSASGLNWWEYDEGYTESIRNKQYQFAGYDPYRVRGGVATPEPDITEEADTIGGLGASENTWLNIWRGVKRNIQYTGQQFSEKYTEFIEDLRRQPTTEHQMMRIGEVTLQAVPKVWWFFQDMLPEKFRQLAGFQKIDSTRYFTKETIGLYMAGGILPKEVEKVAREQYPRLSEEEIKEWVKKARITQEIYKKKREEYEGGPISLYGTLRDPTGHSRALDEAIKAVDWGGVIKEPFSFKRVQQHIMDIALNFPKAAENFAEGREIWPGAAVFEEQWEEAKGFRWTFNDKKYGGYLDAQKAYWEMREAGFSPEEAGSTVEHPWAENIMLCLANPNWIIQLDNVITKPMWKGIKWAGKGVLRGARNLPLVRGGIDFLMGLSLETKARMAARRVDDVVRWVITYLQRTSDDIIDGDLIAKTLADPTMEMIDEMPRYYRAAFLDTIPYRKTAGISLKARLGADTLENLIKGEVSDEILSKRLMEATDNAIDYATRNVARQFREEALEEGGDLLARSYEIFRNNFIGKALIGAKGLFCDVWLGLRPAWVVANWVDNYVKFLIAGGTPGQNLGRLASEYAEITGRATPEQIAEASAFFDDFGKAGFKNLSTENNVKFAAYMDGLLEKKASGVFGTGGQRASLLHKVPVIRNALDWTQAISGRVEMAIRARLLLSSFFNEFNPCWDDIVKKSIGMTIEEAAQAGIKNFDDFIQEGNMIRVSDDVEQAFRETIKGMPNRNPALVRAKLLQRFDTDEIILPKLNDGFDEMTEYLHPDLQRRIVSDLNDMATRTTPEGDVILSKVEIDRLYDKYAKELTDAAYELHGNGIRALDDILPGLPATTDEWYETVTGGRSMDEPMSLTNIRTALSRIKEVVARVDLEDQKALNEFLEEYFKLHDAHKISEACELADNFFGITRPEWWARQTDMEKEVLRTLVYDKAEDAAQRVGIEEIFPTDYVEEYINAIDRFNEFEILRNKSWRETISELYDNRLTGTELGNQLYNLTRKKVDDLYHEMRPKAKDDIREAVMGMVSWINRHLDEVPAETFDPSDLTPGWWLIEDQIESIRPDVRDYMAPRFKELDDWRKWVLTRRGSPATKIGVTEDVKDFLVAYINKTYNNLKIIRDDAMDYAIQRVNDTFFDYELTPRWMAILNEIIPFSRWKSKNIPYWIDVLTGTTRMGALGPMHWTGLIHWIRKIHASINADLPERLRYTVGIPRELTDPVMGLIGLNNTQVRFNPYTFFSFMGQLPGGTPWKYRQMFYLYQEEKDRIAEGEHKTLKDWSDILHEVTGQLGFSLWPHWEFLFGSFGFFGDDWYPFDWFSGWKPILDWAYREGLFAITNDERMLTTEIRPDPDFAIRRLAPTFWNSIWRGTPLEWQQATPALLEEWAVGREIPEVLMTPAKVAAEELVEITPVDAERIIMGMTEAQFKFIRDRVVPIFDLTAEEQAATISTLNEEEKAVFLHESKAIAVRRVLRKRALQALVGQLTGIYPQLVGDAEITTHQQRMQKRLEKEKEEFGAPQREWEKQFRAEHPEYTLLQNWRFGHLEWGTTTAQREAEHWDAIIDSAESDYWNYLDEVKSRHEEELAIYAKYNLGDVSGYNALKKRQREEINKYKEFLNQRLQIELEKRMNAYKRKYPFDKQGIKRLEEGFENEVYVGSHLTAEQREKLLEYVNHNPNDFKGQQKLFEELWKKAQKINPPLVKKRWPGLNEGFTMDIAFNPYTRTPEEIIEYNQGQLFWELSRLTPDYDDYEDKSEYWNAKEEFLESLSDHVLETETGREWFEKLTIEQGLSKEEALKHISNGIDRRAMNEYFKRNHNVWDALYNAYYEKYTHEAGEVFSEEILPLKDEDYALYKLRLETFFDNHGPILAADLIPYIMKMYPGRWTAFELMKEYGDSVLPSWQENQLLKKKGTEKLNKYITDLYYNLDSETQKIVRREFGPAFNELFMEGQEDKVSIPLRGAWANALAKAVGIEKFNWRRIPGIEEERRQEGGDKFDAADYGLPFVGDLTEEREFEEARRIDRQYWEAKARGDEETANALESHPLRKKYFVNSEASYFWRMYFDELPPGWVSKEIKQHPLIKQILDKQIRAYAVSTTDYIEATELLKNWLMLNSELLMDLDYDPAEWPEFRRLQNQYYDIPEEDKAARRAFREDHPLLLKYWRKPDWVGGEYNSWSRSGYSSSGRGGYRGRTSYSSRTDIEGTWKKFKKVTGGKFMTVLRILAKVWKTGEMSDAVRKYLKGIYEKTGSELDFEKWLEILKTAWIRSAGGRNDGGIRVPSWTPKVVQPSRSGGGRYNIRGMRKIRR